ncbi:hypothetical protein FGB62_22g525 [Gracilaria domingensis]|nr:hypothetical protein FGB62_22g525 [Gracilaria domingensis]
MDRSVGMEVVPSAPHAPFSTSTDEEFVPAEGKHATEALTEQPKAHVPPPPAQTVTHAQVDESVSEEYVDAVADVIVDEKQESGEKVLAEEDKVQNVPQAEVLVDYGDLREIDGSEDEGRGEEFADPEVEFGKNKGRVEEGYEAEGEFETGEFNRRVDVTVGGFKGVDVMVLFFVYGVLSVEKLVVTLCKADRASFCAFEYALNTAAIEVEILSKFLKSRSTACVLRYEVSLRSGRKDQFHSLRPFAMAIRHGHSHSRDIGAVQIVNVAYMNHGQPPEQKNRNEEACLIRDSAHCRRGVAVVHRRGMRERMLAMAVAQAWLISLPAQARCKLIQSVRGHAWLAGQPHERTCTRIVSNCHIRSARVSSKRAARCRIHTASAAVDLNQCSRAGGRPSASVARRFARISPSFLSVRVAVSSTIFCLPPPTSLRRPRLS